MLYIGCGLSLDADPPDPQAVRAGRDGGLSGVIDGATADGSLAFDGSEWMDGAGPPDDAATEYLDGMVVAVDGSGGNADAAPLDGAGPDGGAVEAGVTDGGAADAGMTIPVLCGGPTTLQDDFADANIDPLWVAEGATAESGGVLRLGVDPAGDTSRYSSKFAVDAREASVAVELVAPAAGTVAASQAYLALVGRDPGIGIYFIQTPTDLIARSNVPGYLTTGSVAFDSAIHRWLRIRENMGMVHWEASPNGMDWRTLHSFRSPPMMISATMELGGSPSASLANVGFDNFNFDAPRRARAVFCAAHTFSDTFATGPLEPRWQVSTVRGCEVGIGTGAGQVRFVLGAGVTASCSLDTRAAYDLRGDTATIAVPLITDYTDVMSFRFHVVDRHGQGAVVGFQGGMMFTDGPGGITNFPYDGIVYWRFRGDGGVLRFEGSRDGATWTTSMTLAGTVDLSAVSIGFGLQSTNPMLRSIGVGVLQYN